MISLRLSPERVGVEEGRVQHDDEPDAEPGARPERGRRARTRREARRRRRQRRKEQREERREEREDVADAVCETCELADSARGCSGPGCGSPGCGRFGGRGGGRGGDGDGCSCDGPCDGLSLLSVSGLLLVAAAVVPGRGAGGLVCALLRGYQRWLSRFTPTCPGTPSCSAYALVAVREHGAQRGLRLAAARVRACGSPPRPPAPPAHG